MIIWLIGMEYFRDLPCSPFHLCFKINIISVYESWTFSCSHAVFSMNRFKPPRYHHMICMCTYTLICIHFEYIYCTFKSGELLLEFHARSEHQSDDRFVRETSVTTLDF